MDKLETGLYVRTKDFGITKIHSINDTKTKWKYTFETKQQDEDGTINLGVLCKEDIVKASHNIIDLIEVRDYVNGCIVCEIDKNRKYFYLNYNYDLKFFNSEIESIVTHEQFKKMEYEV